MVRAVIQADTLRDYYPQLVAAQQAAHGDDYCDHHQVIRWAVAQGAQSYAELGINQGATLACALLGGFAAVEGVDISLAPFRAVEGLFRAEARRLGVMLSVWEQDSRLPIGECDMMLFDSVHQSSHLRQELEAHGPHVRRFLLIHDTAAVPSLHNTAVAWGLKNRSTVLRRETSGFGFTLLQKQA